MPTSPLAHGIIRAALDGLRTRLDGTPAAPNTISRKRAVFHGALSYATELKLLPANPLHQVRWRVPKTAAAIHPATVATPTQVAAILNQISRTRPELTAFFGCLYYAARRPKKPSPCTGTTSPSPTRDVARSCSAPPARAPPPPGPAPAPRMRRAASSTAPTALSASSPSRPS
jgi:hypothetical protein